MSIQHIWSCTAMADAILASKEGCRCRAKARRRPVIACSDGL